MDISLLLEMAADAHGDRIALGSGADAVSYRDFADRAQRLGARMAADVVPTVGLLDVNGPTFPTLLFAATYAGAPLCPLNYRLSDEALDAAVARLAPVTVYAGTDMACRLTPVDGLRIASVGELGHEKSESETAASDPAPSDQITTDPDRAAVLLFTSGTTGTPKIAVLRQRHLCAYIVSSVEFAGAAEHEAILISVPNYHIAGIASVLSSIYAGRRMVYLPSFEPHEWVRTVLDERITHAMVVPTMLGRILDVIEDGGISLPTLAHLSYGGGRMPVDTIERAMALLPGLDLVNAYGLTETSSTIAVLGPEEHRIAAASDDLDVRRRLGSVGRPLPGIEIEIRDAAGTVLSAGEQGELYVRGEQVAGEYVTHSAVSDDGWYPTRDHGYQDEAGYVFLCGRADDVIVRGGENIAPSEVEDVIAEHPGVTAVAVVGIPDDEWGERVEAVIVPAGESAGLETSIRAAVRGRLRSTRVPEAVHFWDELPFNETGKLLRRVVRDRLSDPEKARQA